ncbi:EF-hand domain-containing protein [Alloyangia pacifica]|uniref:EF hand n=1 Tax=Alloyangia pacifica TaxID=311180 RepID=A0A1I6SBY4_9RHOB|nr:EF-hand domain-containing protein [Alloyangia pacifica]SDG75519.1 EF hand [Alloyangia pacifica]SFS74462.1 EF hand [Alloyangia pacifica]
MKPLIAAATALLLSATALAAQPQGTAGNGPGRGPGDMIKQMDANGDGKVTRAEFDANSRAMFTRMDRNGDGVLSGNELTPPKRPGN